MKYMKIKNIKKYKYNSIKKSKKNKLHSKNKRTRRLKRREKIKILKNKTPLDIQLLSDEMNIGRGYSKPSYSPTINENLISLKSIPRGEMIDCNNKNAFELREPLKIAISNESFFGKKCVPYYTHEAKNILLQKLSANKHINPNNIVPPLQIQSNCWFNTMFVTLFISDKGRKFFHYFRQLMIEGKQSDGKKIPQDLSNAFALLNYAIESSITGSKYAYELNTNNIIKQIYNSIPNSYKKDEFFLVDIDEASNPIKYYTSIINYLDNKSIQLLVVQLKMSFMDNLHDIEKTILNSHKIGHAPHIIILEIIDNESNHIKNKPIQFTINNADYVLDSSIIRDVKKNHFCATFTCEGEEMAYDGMSFHRLVSMEWKNKINTDFVWGFEGSNYSNNDPLQWSFLNGYQLLLYYRV